MTETPPILRHLPKLLGLLGVLPLFAGLAWLTWTVARDTRTMLDTWPRAQVELLGPGESDTVRVAILRDGVRTEAELPRRGDLKNARPGVPFPAFLNPADPADIRINDNTVWAGTGILGFFALALGGVLLFLFTTKPAKLPPPPPDAIHLDSLPFDGPGEEAELESEPQPLDTSGPIILRHPPSRYARHRGRAIFGVIPLLPLLLIGDETDQTFRYSLAACCALWTLAHAIRLRQLAGYRLTADPASFTLTDSTKRTQIDLSPVRRITRLPGDPGAYRLETAAGQPLIEFSRGLIPAAGLQRLLSRLEAHIEKMARF